METINIHTVGDVNIAGYPTLATVKIDCMFPAQAYPFVNQGAIFDPYYYVTTLNNWCDARKLLRYVVSGTPINLPVKLESIDPVGERDGTNDVYATITMREQKILTAVQTGTTFTTASLSRSYSAGTVAKANSYQVVRGDTLSGICRKQYGDANLYAKLAKYNGIKNPSLISIGQIIKLPDKSQL